MNIIHWWIALSVLGLIVSTYLVRESILDIRSLEGKGNGRRVAAISRIIREGVRVSVHLVFLTMGVVVLNSGRVPEFNLFIAGFMWANLSLLINSGVDTWARHHH